MSLADELELVANNYDHELDDEARAILGRCIEALRPLSSEEVIERAARALGNFSDGEDTIGTYFSPGILREAARTVAPIFEQAHKLVDSAGLVAPPEGDNHHNAARCPYCNPTLEAKLAQAELRGIAKGLEAARRAGGQ